LRHHDDLTELVDGWVVELTPSRFDHSRVAFRLGRAVADYADAHALGDVTGEQGGYILARRPDTVRCPDFAFVRAERIHLLSADGFFEGAPDLAVEVVSPGDRPAEMRAKVAQYLAAGTRLVWVVDPDERAVEVWRADGTSEWIRDGSLSGEDVLPGFELPLGRIFVS